MVAHLSGRLGWLKLMRPLASRPIWHIWSDASARPGMGGFLRVRLPTNPGGLQHSLHYASSLQGHIIQINEGGASDYSAMAS